MVKHKSEIIVGQGPKTKHYQGHTHETQVIQDYLYSAFYDTIVAKQLHRKFTSNATQNTLLYISDKKTKKKQSSNEIHSCNVSHSEVLFVFCFLYGNRMFFLLIHTLHLTIYYNIIAFNMMLNHLGIFTLYGKVTYSKQVERILL